MDEVQIESLQLPPEVTTVQAADILGVGKDTVLNYKKKGLLPYRDVASPGSTRPKFMFPLDAVIRMRTTYQTDDPVPEVTREVPRRGTKGRRQYKHLILDEER